MPSATIGKTGTSNSARIASSELRRIWLEELGSDIRDVARSPRIYANTGSCKLPVLGLPASWSEEEPQDQAQQWQQHHRDCPNQFLLIGNGALEHINNRPDITRKYQHAQQAAISEIHHFGFIPF